MSSRQVNEGLDKAILSATLSEGQFQVLSQFIYKECGIHLPPAKRTMVEGRLRKRLRSLNMSSFSQYCDYLFSPNGMDTERVPMIDVVTTNKTDFFREPEHFDLLTTSILPESMNVHGWGIRTELKVWSAACSTGEEPYTLAMVLAEFAGRYHGFHFSVHATDISTLVLEKAVRGVYEEEKVDPVPPPMRKKYLLRSKDPGRQLVRVVPELRELVTFRRQNLMDESYGLRDKMAVIFCRNVIIYFDKRTQESLLNRLCRYLLPGGYLFMGHSETLHGLNVPMVQPVKGMTTVYRRLNR